MTDMAWRGCVGFSKFEVSEYGDIRRKATISRIKGYITCDGYVAYRLTGDDGMIRERTAHRLVIDAFVGEKPHEDYQVAHNNGSRLFNHHSNLRWASSQENHNDRVDHNTSPRGERNPKAKITDDNVRFIRREYRAIKSQGKPRRVAELEELFGLHRATICNIAQGRTWSHIPMENNNE